MKKFVYIIAASILLISCKKERQFFPKDIEQIEIEIVRFDNDIMNVSESSIKEDVNLLYSEYPDFMPRFVEDILGIPSEDTAYLEEQLPKFLNDTTYGFHATNLLEKEKFTDISDLQKELNFAFSRIHYLFPELPLPTLYFFISGFNSSIMFVDDDIAIGADMYLGSDYELYNMVVYDYQKQTMRKECIPADVVSAYLFKNIPYTSHQNRLLDQMIYRGKIIYLLSLILPDEPDYEIMGYTKEQWQWCTKYEKDIWNLVMDKKDLFKTESIVLTSYMNDGPFTSEISQESPARLGTWLGWRIAKSYMNHNEQVSLQEFMKDGDSQKILEQSYYRP